MPLGRRHVQLLPVGDDARRSDRVLPVAAAAASDGERAEARRQERDRRGRPRHLLPIGGVGARP
jgi:hypothetical protein